MILSTVSAAVTDFLGAAFFAADFLGVELGEFVTFEESFQATWAFKDHMIPFDSSITAIIDSIDLKREGNNDIRKDSRQSSNSNKR